MIAWIKNLTLRKKFLILIAGVLFLSSVSVMLIHRHLLLKNYINIERSTAEKDINRAARAIERELTYLENLCIDWASWDETYSFLKNRNRIYIEKNLNTEIFSTGIFDFLCIIDINYEILYEKRILRDIAGENDTGVFSDIDEKSRQKIKNFFMENSGLKKNIKGTVETKHGTLLIAASPVLTGKDTGPVRGYMIMGKYLTPGTIKKIKEQIEVNFEIINPLMPDKAEEYEKLLGELSLSSSSNLILEDKKYLTVVTLNRDINGKQGFLIKSKTRRILLKHGSRVIFISLMIFTGGLVMLMLLMWLFIKQFIIEPVEQMEVQVKAIEEEKYNRDMALTGTDELGHLSRVIDSMAKTIIRKRDRLNEMNRQLELISITDGLTGVYNRRHFDERIKNEWERGIRSGKPLSLIMCDVDFFKKYNDIYGHQGGDECLKSVASAMKKSIHRITDEAYRYGGEEFAILLPDTDEQGIANIAGKILGTIVNLHIEHQGSPDYGVVTVSLGAATIIPVQEIPFSELISHADMGLYRSKEKGRNRMHIAAEKNGEVVHTELTIKM